MEDDLLIGVRMHVFPVELGIELGRDGIECLGGAEEVRERDIFFRAVFGTEFGEGLRAEDLGLWVGGVPGTEEDVVLYNVSMVGSARKGV